MYYSDKVDTEVYEELMEEIKALNQEYSAEKYSRERIMGRKVCLLIDSLKTFRFKKMIASIRKNSRINKSNRIISANYNPYGEKRKAEKPNYFSTERIAIYTCIIGSYDEVREPMCFPDNCDYFLVTDRDRHLKNSVWKQVFVKDFGDEFKGFSGVEVNRYFKMHPDRLFSDYKYSIYIDGNIKVIADLTEFVNKIGELGIAVHKHGGRNCVYEEARAAYALGKLDRAGMKKHIAHFEEIGMPHNFGMAECMIIAREHNLPICKKIMEEWWTEFRKYAKRDQLSLPTVFFLNNSDYLKKARKYGHFTGYKN